MAAPVGDLLSRSRVQNNLVVIQSASRDQARWPNTDTYAVNFSRPFENVVGFDILDATIANSTYTVDLHNNRVGVGVRVGGTGARSGAGAALAAHEGSHSFDAVMGDIVATRSLLKIAPVGTDYRSLAPSSTSGRFVAVEGSVAVSPAQAQNPDAEARAVPAGEGVQLSSASGALQWRYAQPRRGQAAAWIDVFLVGSSALVRLGGRLYTADSAGLEAVPLWDAVTYDAGAIVGRATLEVDSVDFDALTAEHSFELLNFDIEPGDHDIATLVDALTFAIPTYVPDGWPLAVPAVAVQGSSLVAPNNFNLQRKLVFRGRDFFWIDGGRSSARGVLGLGGPAKRFAGQGYTTFGIAGTAFVGVEEVSGAYTQVLRVPGIVNLDGSRAMRLRCPELEEHMPRVDNGDPSEAGIGVFKLYDSVIAHLRFDYNNFRSLLPHPIAKLGRLTLRFEWIDGRPVDFKGSDHHIVIAIHTLAPAIFGSAP